MCTASIFEMDLWRGRHEAQVCVQQRRLIALMYEFHKISNGFLLATYAVTAGTRRCSFFVVSVVLVCFTGSSA